MNISEANAVVTLLAAAGLATAEPTRDAVDSAARFLAERAGKALHLTVLTHPWSGLRLKSVGVDYCTLHHGIREYDRLWCVPAFQEEEADRTGEPRPCECVPLLIVHEVNA